jgi:ribonucleotide monophosphatase NagD (HAD superfamily)
MWGGRGQVGDRLDTDVVFGNENGCKSCLTLSGVTSEGKYLDPRSAPCPRVSTPRYPHSRRHALL